MMKLVVLSCVLAAAAGSLIAPLAYTGPLAYTSPLAYSVPWLAPSNYRGPLSLAPGQPANILATDGRPLDTLDVNLDRSAHYTAKALEGSGVHLLKKRSAPILAPLALNRIAVGPTPLIARAPLAYHSVPLGYSAPLLSSRIIASPYNYGPLSYW